MVDTEAEQVHQDTAAPTMTTRAPALWMALGVLLPPVCVAGGLLLPRSPASSALFPAVFVASGALIGRWWAWLPSLAVVALLSLAELAGIHHAGTIELHGEFDLGFFLFSSAVATILALVGALVGVAARVVVSAIARRLSPGRG